MLCDEELASGCERNKLLLREDSAEPSIGGDILEDKEMEDLELMKESEESTVVQKTARLTGEIVGLCCMPRGNRRYFIVFFRQVQEHPV